MPAVQLLKDKGLLSDNGAHHVWNFVRLSMLNDTRRDEAVEFLTLLGITEDAYEKLRRQPNLVDEDVRKVNQYGALLSQISICVARSYQFYRRTN